MLTRHKKKIILRHGKFHRIYQIADQSIQTIGEILTFLQIDCVHHITNRRNHIFERFVNIFTHFIFN